VRSGSSESRTRLNTYLIWPKVFYMNRLWSRKLGWSAKATSKNTCPDRSASLGVTTEASEVDSDLELVAHTQANAPGNRVADTVRRMIEL
jgi:hypothetical protein